MIAYNENSLDSLVINEEAAKALKKRFITDDEYTAIDHAHKVDLYYPNMFIRIGLFIVSVVIVLMSFGLMMLFLGDAFRSDTGFFTLIIIFSFFIYAALEWIIHSKRHYRSGVDDALLWLTLGFIFAGVNFFTPITALQQSTLIFILSLAAAIRFANSVMTALVFGSFIAIIFFSVTPFGVITKIILPFLVMVISMAIYFIVKKIRGNYTLRHYKYCMLMIEVLSLITVYAAVNYFVVREFSKYVFKLKLPEGASITGGWFFWIATLIIPPVYITRGLRKKDPVILRIGLLLIAATVFTIRNYYTIAPISQVMTIGGIILIFAAYFVIKHLRTPKFGITDKEPDYDALQVESLIITETYQKTPTAGPEGFQFGGGSSGGGGASGQY